MRGAYLILGATSAIARATARELARQGYHLTLAGRDMDELQRDAADIRLRFSVEVEVKPFDAEDFAGHAAFLNGVVDDGGELDGVVLAFGYLGEQTRASQEFAESLAIIQRNYTGAISILNLCAEYLAARGRGTMIAISSVAGDRGRQSNYIYGSAKGGLTIYLEGLRNAMFHRGVHVMTVKPGFVDTAMTYGLSGMFLVATPQAVARRILKARDKGVNTLYAPWFWRWIMLIIRHVPETIFKRLKM
ncbi:MAG: SDR family oxidoreductase [Chromatiales bacterium]|nr:SDR family oxidoreductase [Chromatiales bacterium]